MNFTLLSRLMKNQATQAFLGLFLVIALLRCLWLWQPQRQVILHQDHLLDAAQERNWKRFDSFIAPNYSDRWGHDKAFLVRESSEVLRQFFGLTIQRQRIECRLNGNTAIVLDRLKLDGKGTALATMATSAVNDLHEPFTFEWKRQSWKPWDWALVSADQPELNLDRAGEY